MGKTGSEVSSGPIHVDVLLVADAYSVWTVRYIQRVLLAQGATVALASPRVAESPFRDLLSKSSVTLIDLPRVGRIAAQIPRVRGIVKRHKARRAIRRRVRFEAIHVHRLQKDQILLADGLRNRSRVLVLSYWGSDLLRTPPNRLRGLRKYIARADVLTYNALAMREMIENVYGDVIKDTRYLPFGIDGFDAIDEIEAREGRKESRDRFHLPVDRAVVVVGYNGRVEQQHIAVLQALGALPLEVKCRIYCIAPMAYMSPGADYEMSVSSAMLEYGLTGEVMTSFLDEADQARLSLATDVFVNAQTTDALSASLQEFLYAGSKVLSGAWLDYSELESPDTELVPFGRFDEIPSLVMEALEKPLRPEDLGARRAALRVRSWARLAPKWMSLYDVPPRKSTRIQCDRAD